MAEPDWKVLEHEFHELADRVARLEELAGVMAREAAPVSASAVASDHPLAGLPNLLPIAGRALLGLAGAYLLRAAVESGIVPVRFGTALGVAYALFWLSWAGRRSAQQRWHAAVDSLAALLILCPLLWEATTRFHLIAAWMAAAVLLIFATTAIAISWRKGFGIVTSFATAASLGTGAALLMATHNVLPFAFLFLTIGAALEFCACFAHCFRERWLAAAAADLAVVLANWLTANPRGLPPEYAPIPVAWLLAAQIALLAIYLSSTALRTLWRGQTITTFETAQCVAAFTIWFGGGLGRQPLMPALMSICAAACYAVCFARRTPEKLPSRNFHTYSTFALLLTLTATWMLFGSGVAAESWFGLSAIGLWTGGHFARGTLLAHGSLYLLLALAASGVLRTSAGLLFGAAAWAAPTFPFSAALAASATAYALIWRHSAPRWCATAVAAAFFWMAAATAAGLLASPYRTAAFAGLALFLAWAGSRWKRAEMTLLVYPAMLLGVYRLIVRDLGEGDKTTLFVSLLLLGTVLMALPRFKTGAPRES